MSDRYAVIRDLWELDGDWGYPDDVLENWRGRFGSVPASLAEYYSTLAAHLQLNHTQDQLVAPSEAEGVRFRMDGDDDTEYLVFYVENQAALQWGIHRSDVEADDPNVYVLSEDVWTRSRDTVSEFLIAQAHLQRMYAWEDWSEEFLSIDGDGLARLRGFLPPRGVEVDLYGGIEFFGGPGVVLAYFTDSSSIAFGCADPHLVSSLFGFLARNG